MARADYNVRVDQSVFDRLIDDEPGSPRDPVPTRSETVRQLRESVHRDLDHLLNTRNPLFDLDPDFTEVRRSVLCYGLPDVSALNTGSAVDRQRVRMMIEQTLQRFEPRLAGVSVSLLEHDRPSLPGALYFRIDARLIMDPAPEPVIFDVVMPLINQGFQVRVND